MLNKTNKMVKSALSRSRAIIINSDLMGFGWSDESQRYLEIKISHMFEDFNKVLESSYLNEDPEKEMQLIVTHNMVGLREFPDRIDDTHPIITHSARNGKSYFKPEHFEENSGHFSQDITTEDLTYEFVAYYLQCIKGFASNNVIKTLTYDFIDKMEVENRQRKRDFSLIK
jgi:hypothetical protein